MGRIGKGRPNCAILDTRYKVFPLFVHLYFSEKEDGSDVSGRS